MIEYDDIATMLASISALTGKIRYNLWPKEEAITPPFVVYELPSEDSFGADNTRYFATKAAEVHLVTKNRDFSLEGTVEAKLVSEDIYFTKTADYDEAEAVWIITYYFDAL